MKWLVVFVSAIAASHEAKLPSNFRKCNLKAEDFSSCLKISAEDAISKMKGPIKEVGLPGLEPLEVPEISIGAGQGAAVAFEQNFKNMKFYGFTSIQVDKMIIDFDSKIMQLIGTFPKLRIEAQYDFNGKILLLPIVGQGPCILEFSDADITATLTFDIIKKREKDYLNILTSKLKLNMSLAHFQFDNLFNGNKQLGDDINTVMNENWKEIVYDVLSGYEEALAQIVFDVARRFTGKVPIEEIFENYN